MLASALQHLQSAVELLDAASAPGHVAAHIDLAIHQLSNVIEAQWSIQAQIKVTPNSSDQLAADCDLSSSTELG
jgi:hypothetical protein